MNAMAEDRAGREKPAFFVNIGVIARAHVEMTDLFQFFAVLGQMSLDISPKLVCQLRCAAHQFFRTGYGEPWTKCVIEQAVLSFVPFAAEPFAFQERNRQDFLWLD